MAEQDGHRIYDVLMPMLSGDTDNFGREAVPPIPLSFDRVNEGHPFRSNASLFRLPMEILGEQTVNQVKSIRNLENPNCSNLPDSKLHCMQRIPIDSALCSGIILQNIASSSLASFAYVNSDCRQLARSRQFASIHLQYSLSNHDLLLKLVEERRQRQNKRSDGFSPSLGACIRRITVATHPGWVSYRHGVSLEEEFTEFA